MRTSYDICGPPDAPKPTAEILVALADESISSRLRVAAFLVDVGRFSSGREVAASVVGDLDRELGSR